MKKLLALSHILLGISLLINVEISLAVGEEREEAARSSSSKKTVTIVGGENLDSNRRRGAVSISTGEEETSERKSWCTWLKEKICGCSKKKKKKCDADEPFLSNEDEGADFRSDDLKKQFTNLQPNVLKLPSELLIAAGGLKEEERDELSNKQWCALKTVAWIAAFCTACVEGTMTMQEFQEKVAPVLFETNVSEVHSEFNTGLWIVGGITLGTALIKNYFVSREFLTWLSSASARHRSFSRRGSNLMLAGTALLATSLAFKPAFTLYQVFDGGDFNNTDNRTLHENPLYRYHSIMDLFSIASLFWITSLVQESVSYAAADLNSLVRGIIRSRYRSVLHEQQRDIIRRQLGEGFKKLLEQPRAAAELYCQIKKMEEEIEETNNGISTEIGGLGEEGQVKAFSLMSEQRHNEEAGSLVMLKALVGFSDEEVIVLSAVRFQNSPQAFCDDHPGWYKCWYNFGRLIPLGGAVSIWAGWSYSIREVFSTGEISSFFIGSLISAFFLPYMVEGAGKSMANMIARCSNYNPVKGARYVSAAVEHLNYGKCNKALRGFVDVISLMSGLLVKVPSSVLGLEGMNEFFPSSFAYSSAPISLALFSWLSFGLVARNGAEEAYQGMITKLKCCMGNTLVYKYQQRLAGIYKEADKWVSHLHPDLVYFLVDFLDKDLEGGDVLLEEQADPVEKDE